MAQYLARMTDVRLRGERLVEFQGVDGLLDQTPVRVVRAFFDHVQKAELPPFADYEINAALKNKERRVVVCVGGFHLDEEESEAPFTLMIGDAD